MNTNDVCEYIKANTIFDSDDHVVVREIWKNRYRVNVWKYDPNRIVKSYFVKVDNDRIECNPNITA